MAKSRPDYVLCSLLNSIEVKGFMQNLDPPRLQVAEHSSLEWFRKLNKGTVVYTIKNSDEYPLTMNGFILIPKGDIVGVE